MSEKSYGRLLKELIDDIYLHWQGDWKTFAKKAGLSYSTVCKLGRYETKRPHLRTIVKLAKAAQMKIEFDFRKPKLKLAA